MAADCAQARSAITISSLSMHVPRGLPQTAYGRLWESWIRAAERGIRVDFLLAAPTKIHPATAQNATTAVRAHAHGIQTKFVAGSRLLHAKTAIIDDLILWVGSGNMTAAAAHYNHECYVRYESSRDAAALLARWREIANL